MKRREELLPIIEGRIKSEYKKHKSLDWAKIAASKITSDIINMEQREKDFLRKTIEDYWRELLSHGETVMAGSVAVLKYKIFGKD